MAKPKPVAGAAPDAVAPKKGGKMLLIILPLLAAVVGVGVGATQAGRFTGGGDGEHAEAAAEAEHAAEEAVAFGEFHEIEGLIVNPAGSNGRRFLLVNLSLEAETAEEIEEVKTREAVVRDVIAGDLGQLTVEQLSAVGARDVLKDSLLVHVNEALGEAAEVRRLYFTQYVIQ